MRIAVPLLFLLIGAPAAFAHAILVRSVPMDQGVVHSRSIVLVLDYNSRIDANRCTLTLTGRRGQRLPLQMRRDAKPWELRAATGNLPNGNYTVHWQVLASDGHITRGAIAFTVAVK